jgi:hypothetical protein
LIFTLNRYESNVSEYRIFGKKKLSVIGINSDSGYFFAGMMKRQNIHCGKEKNKILSEFYFFFSALFPD